MNDCLLSWINLCECDCGKCNKYISVNSRYGRELSEDYKNDVSKAIEPITEKWREKLELRG